MPALIHPLMHPEPQQSSRSAIHQIRLLGARPEGGTCTNSSSGGGSGGGGCANEADSDKPMHASFWDLPAAATNKARALRDASGAMPYQSLFSLSTPAELMAVLLTSQSPANCSAAKYLVMEDIHGGAGFGAAFTRYVQRFMAGVATGRVAVHGAGVVEGQRWRWCTHHPRSLR